MTTPLSTTAGNRSATSGAEGCGCARILTLYDGSLAVATLLDTEDGGRPATYLVYANRSRGDLLNGGFGGLRKNAARGQARRAAEQTLGSIKQALEAAKP